MENDIRFSVVAACPHPQVDYEAYAYTPEGAWARTPNRVIQYASCHDNMTLWDRISFSRKQASLEERLAMNRLSASIVFTSQGVPFFLHGEERLRSKSFHDNSFNLPLNVNAISYHLSSCEKDMLAFYRSLIAFRKAMPQLHMTTQEEIARKIRFIDTTSMPSVVAYWADDLLIVYNASTQTIALPVPTSGRYETYIHGDHVSVTPFAECNFTTADLITIHPISCYVARRKEKTT